MPSRVNATRLLMLQLGLAQTISQLAAVEVESGSRDRVVHFIRWDEKVDPDQCQALSWR